ncbi:hypothetical protein J1N35_039624 [Gossypium stocksii]|uniref:tRNA (adenine(58)-N(1))-methyltransferase n=1 Tax=Gossypium stocksii TaxID=47602 RepID=A0A9D3UC69_9ROSI|nr:hypothetical protein J1N35_039624 [Gossypium stocksii]
MMMLFSYLYTYILMNSGLPGILGDSLFLMELWICGKYFRFGESILVQKLHISPTSSVYSIECVFRILRILLIDSLMKISFNRYIRDGDLIIVYERHDTMKAVKVCENSVLQNRFGVFKHSDWIGKPFGSIIFSNRGGFVYLLAPTLELWILVLSQRTQILYIVDISFVLMYLEVVPGCLVLESGTGSASSGTCVYL